MLAHQASGDVTVSVLRQCQHTLHTAFMTQPRTAWHFHEQLCPVPSMPDRFVLGRGRRLTRQQLEELAARSQSSASSTTYPSPPGANALPRNAAAPGSRSAALGSEPVHTTPEAPQRRPVRLAAQSVFEAAIQKLAPTAAQGNQAEHWSIPEAVPEIVDGGTLSFGDAAAARVTSAAAAKPAPSPTAVTGDESGPRQGDRQEQQAKRATSRRKASIARPHRLSDVNAIPLPVSASRAGTAHHEGVRPAPVGRIPGLIPINAI